jgi:hypothetical protein
MNLQKPITWLAGGSTVIRVKKEEKEEKDHSLAYVHADDGS